MIGSHLEFVFNHKRLEETTCQLSDYKTGVKIPLGATKQRKLLHESGGQKNLSASLTPLQLQIYDNHTNKTISFTQNLLCVQNHIDFFFPEK